MAIITGSTGRITKKFVAKYLHKNPAIHSVNRTHGTVAL
jgi:hypothetical protein